MRSFVVRGLAILCAGAGVAFAADRWEQPAERMRVAGEAAPAGGKPALGEPFAVPAGFRVERLFVVPSEELGSWVCLATDPQGRLIASDQADKGLVRITPAPLDGSKPTVVERIPADIGSAQGLLWAFDALYAVRNGGPASGLYRVTDANGDGTLDAVEKLRGLDGDGEHGPHAVRLSPDGTRLVIVCGNHTQPPFAVKDVTPPQTMAGVRDTQRRTELPADGTSRLPANWDEDQIIPRLWDATGHAVGILAPGGYIASTDRDGKAWEIWSAGYRNTYDIAFNADGELFAYDSDMEWDFGMPWYRPTRVNHATSGSELGWRSGSGKWPACFPDSLPACLEIGPGSPVGVTFGYGAKFPEKYQRAFFICDWTFGTIYAVHLAPEGSTYRATKEQFLSRTPLPLTDAVVAADGAMYFTVGGRGGQSELYRVSYVGSEPTDTVDAKNTAGSAERTLRRDLEALHRRAGDPAAAVATALAHLSHPDRFIRYAARIALEHQPIELWQARALALPEPRARIAAALAVARQGEPAAQSAVFAALDAVDPAALDAAGTIDLARAYELAIVRLGLPPADVQAKIAARFAPLFPSGSFDLDRELSSLLVALRAPGIVTKLCGLLATPQSGATNLAPDEEELRQVIARNAEYGSAVRASLEKRSDLIQIHYAYALRTIREREAWTAKDRQAYHGWFRRAREWVGGHSFRKFLANIEAESLAGYTENERLAMEAQGILERWVPPPLPKPEGPGRAWTVETVLAAADKGLAAGRDFEHGKKTFAAARCVVCHRYDGDGGATGPDLTQAAGRFQIKDLVEAMVLPSKIISDQYKASVVLTADGRSVTGRIVSESPEKIIVVTDPEDATKFVEIARADIEEVIASPESLMPRGLLDQLNEAEVLDLLAYILSRGDDDDPRFAPAAPATGPSGPAGDGAEAAAPAAAEGGADLSAPIAHWTLDETVGMVASDAVGGHHGTIQGTSWADGRIGGARLFVRANGDNIDVPYHPDFDVSSFTVSAWVRLTQPPTASGIVGTRHAGDNTFDMKIEADRIHGDVGNGHGWIDISVVADEHDVGSDGQGGRLELDRWYLVTFVVDDAAKEIRIFLDGDCKKVTPYVGTARLMKPGQSLRIGNSFGPDEVMDGAIDDVKIWSRPLSPAEVESLAKS